jgi:uncharacterized protein (DUF4415 family)
MLRVDADVLEWFRATGKGYQTRINSVLRQFVGLQELKAGRAKKANGDGHS